jgi:type II secretory pathway component GspD/PulD (secretin)
MGGGKPGDDAFRILKENKPVPRAIVQQEDSTFLDSAPEQSSDENIALVAFTQDAFPAPLGNQGTTGNANGIQGLKGEVKIFIDPVTGQATLIGADEDTALVAKVLEDLNKQAPKAAAERILLNNISSEEIAETVQTIYDDNFAPSQGQASISALRSPNGLMVFGTKEAIESVRSIVKEFDGNAPPLTDIDGPFATFRLQHISAVDAKIRLDGYFGQAGDGGGENRIPADPVTTIADFRSNVLIVRGAKQYLDQAEKLIRAIDVNDGGSTDVVRIFQLKNTLAEEIAPVLQDAVSGQQANAGQGYNPNQNAQQQNVQQGQADASTSTLKSGNLRLKAIGADGREVAGGIMFGVRITADSNSNSLVVRGPESSMSLIEELILQLDRLPDAETLIKVFAVVNGDAQSLLETLESLFSSDQNQQGQFGNQTGSTNSLPLQSASATQGASLVNLRFSIDERTNSIIATGPAGDLRVVEDLINRLDETDFDQRKTVVLRLSNSPVLDVQQALQTWLDARNERNADDPRTNPSVALAERDVDVVAEVVSNSLIISATPQYLPEVMEVIERLDRRPPMVKVKVMIAEVDLNSLEEFGVEVGVQDSLLFDRGTVVDATNAITGGIGFPFNSTEVANSNARLPETLAGQALTNFGTGRISTSGQSGLVLSAGSESINVLIRALKTRNCLRVLSKPHVVTLENLQGRIAVGQRVPRITGSTQNQIGGGIQNSVEDVDVGVILEMTPRVSPDGMIVLFVNAVKSNLDTGGPGVPVAVGADGTPVLQQPINSTSAQTTIMARSGQTVAFTGLIQETKTHSEVGVPVLSDLPVVGPLFKFESDSARRTELLIILTPYLVDGDEEIEIQNQDEMDRMHWCLCDVAEVYGKTDYNGYEYQDGAVETIYPDQGFAPVDSVESMEIYSPSVNENEVYEYGSPLSKAPPAKTKRKFEFNPLKRFVRQASTGDDRDGQGFVNQADFESPSQTQRQK